MHITGVYRHIHYISVFITACLCRIRKALFMLALVKHAAFRVGCRFRNFLFFGRFSFVKRLLAVVVSLFVNFFHQLLFVGLCRLRYRLFDRFL